MAGVPATTSPAASDPAALFALALALALAALIGLVALHRDRLRRILLTAIDPRPLALFRIVLGVALLLYAFEVAPLATYLFSDEGLLPSAAVPQAIARSAGDALGDGVREPAGLPDGWALLHYLASGRWSLLHFWDAPAFVHLHLAAFAAAALALTLGWRTRLAAALTWLLLAGLLRRGDAHWGGEQVYLALLFPLVLARSGEAFSLDNRRRCRRLGARGLLSRPGGPGDGRGLAPGPDHPQGLAAIYRRVPAWPQALLVAQLALLYLVNGWAKSGPTWVSGDTLLFSLHIDRYARLDWHPLALSLGPWPFRLATWGVLAWERLFPLVLVGLWLRAAARSGASPLDGRAAALARALWLALAAALAVAATTQPALLAASPGPIGGARVALLALAALAIGAAALAGPPLARAIAGSPLARLRAALARVGPPLLAPAPWLLFGLAFHLVSVIFMEIGAFALAAVAAYLVAGAGRPAIGLVQRVAAALARRGLPVPEHLRQETPIRAEDPSLPHLHRDAAALPAWAIAAAGALVLAGGALALGAPRGAAVAPITWWHGAWLSAAALLLVVARRSLPAADAPPSAPAAAAAPPDPASPARPWAHGPAGRLAAAGVFAYHLVALCAWQAPAWPVVPWRERARALVDPWMELTFTRQLWSMFAPNGPTRNQTIRTEITDAAGVVHDLGTELERPENLVRPYLRHDRWRKVDEAVSGYRSALTPWHARYLCRRWAQDHGGQAPREVALARVVAPVPPLEPLDPLAYFWEHAEVAPLVRIRCADEPFAQLQPEVRARHGLPPADPAELRYTWPQGQPSSWPERRARKDPLTLAWPLLALALAGALALAAADDRRRARRRRQRERAG